MKVLVWVGMLMLVLGIASLVVPIPHNEREGFMAGGVSVGIETQHEEKVSPYVSAAVILGGIGMIVVGKMKGEPGSCGFVRSAGLDCPFSSAAKLRRRPTVRMRRESAA
jgi:hypothetical protein